MARFVHPLQRKLRCTSEVRLRRVWTRRDVRCAGTHLDCPACKRVQFPVAFRRTLARESRRVKFGSDSPMAVLRARRRRAIRRCH